MLSFLAFVGGVISILCSLPENAAGAQGSATLAGSSGVPPPEASEPAVKIQVPPASLPPQTRSGATIIVDSRAASATLMAVGVGGTNAPSAALTASPPALSHMPPASATVPSMNQIPSASATAPIPSERPKAVPPAVVPAAGAARPASSAKAGPPSAGKAAAKQKAEASDALLEDLHKRAVIVTMPSAYAAHIGKPTGENAEVFLSWYIGSLYRYDEVKSYDQTRGLFIQQIMSLYIGADTKWAFLRESGWRPAVAMGYYGGFGLPSFAGGTVKASTVTKENDTLVKKEPVKSAFMHNGYAVMSKQFRWLTVSGGAMYGYKKAFPRFLPMLRNASFSTMSNPASGEMLTAFGGVDLAWKMRHFKLEAVTVPQENVTRPWLIQSHIDGFLGFDFAVVRDRIGYQVVGYYVLPFIRWPDKKRLLKEIERSKTRRQ